VLPSCKEEDPARDIDACIEESIAQGRTANWTQGIWHISGSGERESCSDEALDADEFSLSSKPIRVHQQGHYLFLENPELHPGFTLSGLVGDRCIHIKTTEKTSYGTSIRYDLPARFVGSSSFSGDFRSSGPAGCEGKGEFSVSVKLDPVPATPANPAPADAGVPTTELCKACKLGCADLEAEYIAECQTSCEQFVCKIGLDAGLEADAPDAGSDAEDAGEEAEAAAADAETDALDDVEVEAGDASDDALEDASDDVVDGEAQDAAIDAEADAGPEAGQPDSSGPVYVLWDGAVEIDEEALEDAANGCSMSSRGTSGAWLVLGMAGILGWWTRRRRGYR